MSVNNALTIHLQCRGPLTRRLTRSVYDLRTSLCNKNIYLAKTPRCRNYSDRSVGNSTTATVLQWRRRCRRAGAAASPGSSVAATSARGGRGRSRGPIGDVCVDYCCCCRSGRSAGKAAGYPKWWPAPRRRKHSISLSMMVVPLPPYWNRWLQHTSRPI